MTEQQATPPAEPAQSPAPGSSRLSAAQQEAMDDAIEKALGGEQDRPVRPDVPLKRQWDDELEAQMEAALSGFDPKTFEVGRGTLSLDGD